MAKIGDKIRYQRKIKNYTLEELGKAVGVTSSTVSKYENGSINIPNKQIEKLASALGCSPGYLMGWEDDVKEEGLRMVARNKKNPNLEPWDKFDKLAEDKKKVVTDLINLYFETNVEEKE